VGGGYKQATMRLQDRGEETVLIDEGNYAQLSICTRGLCIEKLMKST